MDSLTLQNMATLRPWFNWLRNYNKLGFLGEVGWPSGSDSASWNRLADSFLSACESAGVWVCYFGVGETFGDPTWVPGLPCYNATNGSTTASPLAQTMSQAATLEQHLNTDTKRIRKGVNYIGGEFPLALAGGAAAGVTNPSSNAREAAGWSFGFDGPYDAVDRFTHQWNYGRAASFKYLASRGVDLLRLTFRWERVQRALNGPLDETELVRIETAVAAAGAAGLSVILDCHNFGTYFLDNGAVGVSTPIGTGTVTTSAFADLWSRLSNRFKNNANVLAYDLMNEPAAASIANWNAASQAAVSAIRANSDGKLVMVSGGGGGSPGGAYDWGINGAPWITDSANNHRYQAHQYFDGSDYPRTYAAANTAASGSYPADAVVSATYVYSCGYPSRT